MLLLVAFSCLILTTHALERKISSDINPDCEVEEYNCTEFNVVHVQAEGANDTLHYLWDLTAIPGVLLALTSKEAVLSIDWPNYKNGTNKTVSLLPPPIYSYGLVLKQVIEFNDVNDTGHFNHSTNEFVVFDPSNFNWTRVKYEQDDKHVVVTVEASGYNNGTDFKNGTINLQVKGFGYFDHADELPRLVHTPNTTLIDVEIINFSPSFSNSRYAIQLIIVSEDLSNETMTIVSRKSLDDENAPGVFTLVDIVTPSSLLYESGGYLQWRPVIYLSKQRDISNSTSCSINGVEYVNQTILLNTLLSAYYGTFDNNILVQSATISFGEPEDGFYKNTEYTVWSFAIGYGYPPSEEFSLLIILVISIGLGLPAILVVISGIVLSVKRASKKKDDLFLSR